MTELMAPGVITETTPELCTIALVLTLRGHGSVAVRKGDCKQRAQHPPCITSDVCAQNLDIVSILALHTFGEMHHTWEMEEGSLFRALGTVPGSPWNHFIRASWLLREISRSFTEERTTVHRRDSARPLTVSKCGAGCHTCL